MMDRNVQCPDRLPRQYSGRHGRALFKGARPPRWPVSGLAGRFHRLPRRAVSGSAQWLV